MISETTFASRFSSIWAALVPMLEVYVRRANLQLYERIWTPLQTEIDAERQAFLSECAFGFFAVAKEGIAPKGIPSEITSKAIARVRRLSGGKTTGDESLSETEERYVRDLALRITQYLKMRNMKSVVVSPKIAGCGYIDNCEGDILAEKTLIEIKNVDRNFRSTDFRQLIVYLSLNHKSGDFPIENLSLLNPRKGIVVEANADEFIFEISGRSLPELAEEFVEIVTGANISR